MATQGRIVEVIFENAVETYEHQMQMMNLVDVFRPDPANYQNAGNFVWRPVQQHRPIIEGWDLTGQETTIVEETYPAILGTPKNDFFQQRADDLRDMQFWERAGKQSGLQQATELNKSLAQLVVNTGSLYFQNNEGNGYNFVAEAQALMNERQVMSDMRHFVLNDRDNLTFGEQLAGRQTLQGRPEQTWQTGQIGQNVAEFDIFTGSYLPNLTIGTQATGVTVDGAQSFDPEGGTVNTSTGAVSNVDYRVATLTTSTNTALNIGDRINIAGVNAVGLADKNSTNRLMTFVVIAKPTATTIQIYPKPIAADNSDTLFAAYANVDTSPADTAAITRVNAHASTTSAKTNIFWAKDSLEITAGDAPLQLLAEFDGMKVIQRQLKSGLNMYMAYDGNLATLNFRCRLFTWYGLTNKNPMANGCATTLAAV